MKENNEVCDILLVSHNDIIHVVEAPAYKAEEGDMVEFAPVSSLVLGKVVDKLFCIKGEAEYRCIGKVLPIHPARRIYNVRWEAWEGEDEQGG